MMRSFLVQMLKKLLPVAVLLLPCAFSSYSQEMYGVDLGNYSGVNGIRLNPSSLYHNKAYMDVNFITAGAFLQQNYLYLKSSEFKLADPFRTGYVLPAHTEYGTSGLTFYHFSNKNFRQVYENIRIDGPGFMLSFGPNSIALTTSIRSVFSVRDLPYEIANFAYIGLNYTPQQNTIYHDRYYFGAAELTWMDIGLTYSTILYGRNFDVVSGGITARRLEGYSGAYLYSRDAKYKVPDDTTLTVYNMNANYGVSLPLDYNAQRYWNNSFFKGGGFAFDIGITYYRLNRLHQKQYYNHLCEPKSEDYLYRIGIALIDAGAIQFNTHAMQYSIDNRPSQWDQLNHFHYSTIQQLLDTISYRFYGNNSAAYRGNKITVWLPSALSVQFDYHLYRNWYINASAIYGFRFAGNSLSRPTQLAITPRYESDWFEVNMPVSLYDFTTPRIGLSLRFYGFTIGTDKLGWLLNAGNQTGMDIYCSIKFFLNKGRCRTSIKSNCQDYNMIHKSYR